MQPYMNKTNSNIYCSPSHTASTATSGSYVINPGLWIC